jgi:hypothetical protein
LPARSTPACWEKPCLVLFEEQKRGRWRGRTPTNKLVFVDSQEDLLGQERTVRIEWTGPWSLIGALDTSSPESSAVSHPAHID